MSDAKLNIIGFIRTPNGFIIKDALGRTYDCNSPVDLWNDLHAISSDKALPGSVMAQSVVEEEGNEDLLSDAAMQVRDMVGDSHGKFMGFIAGELTRKLAPQGVRVLRNMSKSNRFGRRKKAGS